MAARGSVEKYSELAQHAHLKRRDPQQQRRRLLTVACAAGGVRYSSALACAAAIVRSDGPMGLLKGWCARAFRTAWLCRAGAHTATYQCSAVAK